jgi:hypothetical protein
MSAHNELGALAESLGVPARIFEEPKIRVRHRHLKFDRARTKQLEHRRQVITEQVLQPIVDKMVDDGILPPTKDGKPPKITY